MTQSQGSHRQMLPSAIQASLFGSKEREPEILVSPRMLRPYEAKILFVKNGKLPADAYVNPSPHDFRQVKQTYSSY